MILINDLWSSKIVSDRWVSGAKVTGTNCLEAPEATGVAIVRRNPVPARSDQRLWPNQDQVRFFVNPVPIITCNSLRRRLLGHSSNGTHTGKRDNSRDRSIQPWPFPWAWPDIPIPTELLTPAPSSRYNSLRQRLLGHSSNGTHTGKRDNSRDTSIQPWPFPWAWPDIPIPTELLTTAPSGRYNSLRRRLLGHSSNGTHTGKQDNSRDTSIQPWPFSLAWPDIPIPTELLTPAPSGRYNSLRRRLLGHSSIIIIICRLI